MRFNMLNYFFPSGAIPPLKSGSCRAFVGKMWLG